MASNRASTAMGGGGKKKSKSKKSAKKHVNEMHIRHSANGGFIAKHHFKPGADGTPVEPEEHTIPDPEELGQHVQDNMSTPPPGAGGGMPMPSPIQETPRGGM